MNVIACDSKRADSCVVKLDEKWNQIIPDIGPGQNAGSPYTVFEVPVSPFKIESSS